MQGSLQQGHQLPSPYPWRYEKQAEEWRSLLVEKGKGCGCAQLEAIACSDFRQANEKWGVLCDCLGEHIWPSPDGPELEAGAKSREAGSY